MLLKQQLEVNNHFISKNIIRHDRTSGELTFLHNCVQLNQTLPASVPGHAPPEGFWAKNERVTELKLETLKVSCSSVCNSRVSGQKKTNRQVQHESCFPSVVLACDEPRLLIYGADSEASFLPENLHVYCIFNPPRPGLCMWVTVHNSSCALIDTAETEVVNLLQ